MSTITQHRSVVGEDSNLNGTIRNPAYLDRLRAVPYVPGPVPTPAECGRRRVGYMMCQACLGAILGCSGERVAAFEDGSLIVGADGDTWPLKVYAVMGDAIGPPYVRRTRPSPL